MNARISTVSLILAIAAASGSVRAQEDDGDAPDAQDQAEVHVVLRALLSDQQFDQQIFGRLGSAESAYARLNQLLSVELRRLDRHYRCRNRAP